MNSSYLHIINLITAMLNFEIPSYNNCIIFLVFKFKVNL